MTVRPEVLLLDNPLAGLDPRQTRWWLDTLAALNAGRMWGAALDVVADEPPTSAQAALIAHPKVITTSHCAGAAVEANTRAAAMCLDEVLRVVGGEAPLHVVPELR